MYVHEFNFPEQKKIDRFPFPLALDGQNIPNEHVALEWIHEHKDRLKEQLLEHGAILLRGFPLRGAEAFENALDTAEFVNMPYVGGAAPREEVTHGRILTANESPPEEPIPFHHEMAQVPNPPAYVFFYCEIAASVGGSTPIVHSHTVYKRFKQIHPEFCSKVEKQGVRYRRVMPAYDDNTSPIGRSWRSTFLTEDRKEAERKMQEIGTSWRWLENDELFTETAVVPAIRVEKRSGKATFFNSMVAAYTGWQDCRNDAKTAVVCADGSLMNGDVLVQTAQAMKEEAVAFKWQEGDMLWIDNSLVLHSRQPFSGKRRILASIAIG